MKKKIGNFGKFDDIGYFAVGNEELKNQPKAGKFTNCPNCKKKHKVQYGKDTKTGEIDTIVGFVNCSSNGKAYLVAINQILI